MRRSGEYAAAVADDLEARIHGTPLVLADRRPEDARDAFLVEGDEEVNRALLELDQTGELVGGERAEGTSFEEHVDRRAGDVAREPRGALGVGSRVASRRGDEARGHGTAVERGAANVGEQPRSVETSSVAARGHRRLATVHLDRGCGRGSASRTSDLRQEC